MFLKKKRNCHETIHDGSVGLKETIYDIAIGMKSRFVGFFKQTMNCVSD